jgi:hypothetical protein
MLATRLTTRGRGPRYLALERMSVTSVEIDFEHRLATIELSDGRRETFAMPEALAAAGAPFLRSRFDFTSNTLSFTVASGDVLIVEVGVAGAADGPPPGRPVVYLDQLHWVSLAKQRHAPEKLNEATADAATALIQLADAQRILLPLSAGHLTEMAHLEGRWREHLGLTLMALSRGWQMRNPVAVRKTEFLRSMRGDSPRTPGVFTLQPEVLFVASQRSEPATDLPPPFDDLLPRLTWASALHATVLDDEAIDMREGHEAAERWAAGFPALAHYMREHKTSAEHARINTRARLIADLGDETALAAQRAGLSPDQYSLWLTEELPNRLREMPYVGRLHEVLYHRLRNSNDKWERNDLIDMNFLCCAAGYADIVVGEKHTSQYLRRAESMSAPGAIVCRTLQEAIDALRRIGIST